jgi:hypothetical protein
MGLVSEIAGRLGLTVLSRAGMELVSLEAARNILRACEGESALVLGVEGFHLANDSVVPDMEALADFSGASHLPASERIASSVADALTFLDAMSDRKLLFDLTLTRQVDQRG